MNVTQLVQLYAPLAGLLVVVFWLGKLSQQVKTLEFDVATLKRESDDGSDHDRLVRLEEKIGTVVESVVSMNRSMQGVQRQLANLMKPGTAIHDFEGGR